MQFRTIQRADLAVALLVPPAVIMAVIDDRVTILLIAAATAAVIRSIFVRTVVVALKAGQGQPQPPRKRLAAVHDLTLHRESRVPSDVGAADLN